MICNQEEQKSPSQTVYSKMTWFQLGSGICDLEPALLPLDKTSHRVLLCT
jgi:hypothetical protein